MVRVQWENGDDDNDNNDQNSIDDDGDDDNDNNNQNSIDDDAYWVKSWKAAFTEHDTSTVQIHKSVTDPWIIMMRMMRILVPEGIGYLEPGSWELSLFLVYLFVSLLVFVRQLNLALTVG